MLLDVALTPDLLKRPDEYVCVMVDVLRASSACVTMFDSGVESVAVAADPEAALQLRNEAMPGALLCGEVGGLPPPGFDYGNSPAEFSAIDLHGRTAVIATSNGTKALHAVARAPAVFVGCLLNRAAVCEAALVEAGRHGAGIAVVCAGNNYGTTFSLDDAFTAGALIRALDGRARTGSQRSSPDLTDAATMTCRLFDSYDGDGLAAFHDGSHGRGLVQLGFDTDLAFCAQIDRSAVAPRLIVARGGHLMLVRESSRAD